MKPTREIKFRAWHKYRKEMHEVRGWSENFVTVKTPLIISGLEVNTFDIREVELMQYANLTDRNGKEIYESDLIRLETSTMPLNDGIVQEVKFEDCGYWLCGGQRHSLKVPESVKMEIIGNIYETPELL